MLGRISFSVTHLFVHNSLTSETTRTPSFNLEHSRSFFEISSFLWLSHKFWCCPLALMEFWNTSAQKRCCCCCPSWKYSKRRRKKLDSWQMNCKCKRCPPMNTQWIFFFLLFSYISDCCDMLAVWDSWAISWDIPVWKFLYKNSLTVYRKIPATHESLGDDEIDRPSTLQKIKWI